MTSSIWPAFEHVLCTHDDGLPHALRTYPDSTQFLGSTARVSHRILNELPVDFLVAHGVQNTEWRSWVLHCQVNLRPRLVIEIWTGPHLGWIQQAASKRECKLWTDLGYGTQIKALPNQRMGGAVSVIYTVVVRAATTWTASGIDWPDLQPASERSMANCLRHCGVPRRCYITKSNAQSVVDSATSAMPMDRLALIQTDRGVRRLFPDELGKALGSSLPGEVLKQAKWRVLFHTPSQHLLEYLSTPLMDLARHVHRHSEHSQPTTLTTERRRRRRRRRRRQTHQIMPEGNNGDSQYQWSPPDLSPGGDWHQRRVGNLRQACARYGKRSASLLEDGLDDLRVHRTNYTDTHPDPKQLRVLWWEFPQQHWDHLREGSPMNFLGTPESGHHDNTDMTAEQQQVAADFVDELLSLGVVEPQDPLHPVVVNAPLFALPKPMQPDQWRIIANMRENRTNEFIGADPTIFPKSRDILKQMYHGGWSAVVDASKYFYQFRTRPDERRFLGIQHPISGKMYQYAGLPMGSSQSPAIACRLGTAFLRRLREHSPIYQGTQRSNMWWTAFDQGLDYDHTRGQGLVSIGADGLPAALVWAHCDDFIIHGPTRRKTAAALSAFLDLSVDCGLLCHPGKLTPPSQVVKYTGLIFDTMSTPRLRIPPLKRDKIIAVLDYIEATPTRVSRLALAVLAGMLESVAEATPSYLGRNYLRALYALVHPDEWDQPDLPYFSYTALTHAVTQDLQWWRSALTNDTARSGRATRTGILVSSFGDGSGTGTGGTILFPSQPSCMWMGTWSSLVATRHSSNWKELRTLLSTLQQVANNPASVMDVFGATFFYFTDNMYTYCVVDGGTSTSPELHKMVRKIKQLELRLSCHLQVIHIPGTAIITEGTDGLSRGIWINAAHQRPTSSQILSACLAPAPLQQRHVSRIASLAFPDTLTTVLLRRWDRPWNPGSCMNCITLWAPPPELAYQLIYFLLGCWAEQPLDTGFVILVPRVLQRTFVRLSRHLIRVGVFTNDDLSLSSPSPLNIPNLVLSRLPEWTLLPAPGIDGITNGSPSVCTGCARSINRHTAAHQCHFADSGFTHNGISYQPCHTRYHKLCCRAGPPFRTRLRNHKGLMLPPNLSILGLFVCEACTVRVHLQRELVSSPTDYHLLRLERMRIIDMAHNWAAGTLTAYSSKIQVLRKFGLQYGIPTMQPPDIQSPPCSDTIPIMWAQEHYATQAPSRKNALDAQTIKFSTVRGLRSAASAFGMWNMCIAHPERAMLDAKQRPITVDTCLPTDHLGYSMLTQGMRTRLGEDSRPSAALLSRHIHFMDQSFRHQYQHAVTPQQRRTAAMAGVINLMGWLGWLRAAETFGISWSDVTILDPRDASNNDLPPNTGAVLLRLAMQTKSDRSRQADVVIAFRTSSGLSLGDWMLRARTERDHHVPTDLVAHHPSGQPWTSQFYRTTFVYPSLLEQQQRGDTFLRSAIGAQQVPIPTRFYSFHMYRRGGRTHVSRKRPGCVRAATKLEVSEHGRWRRQRANEDMPTAYLQWPLADRLRITALCM